MCWTVQIEHWAIDLDFLNEPFSPEERYAGKFRFTSYSENSEPIASFAT
jgi:hypothetical protein